MFFVNDDLKKSTNQKNLREVIDDETVKVAYGVLSLSTFYRMVKRIGGGEKIFIPKVQRGLVWSESGKGEFIKNCILGNDDNVREPMPNIFLFCDSTTNEIQLFDGLQRTSAILNEFENIDDIKPEFDVMIPAALFKGTRSEAETLFRNINDKGVKLNDFEKLASYGGAYEVNFDKQTPDFVEKFNDFVEFTTKQYKKIGLETSNKEKTTIYEVLTYAIYSFSKTEAALKIFPKKEGESFIKEWGFQLAYSTTTTLKKKEYKEALMSTNLLQDFSVKIGYKKDECTFDEAKLEEYINDMHSAIIFTEKSIRELCQRNITSNNKENINKSAIKSSSYVSSVVGASYLYKNSVNREFIEKWYLLQLISGRSNSKTNTIIDELIGDMSKTVGDITRSIETKIQHNINEEPTKKTHNKWLWTLFFIHHEEIKKADLVTQFEIDHIIPKKKMREMGIRPEMMNHIGNLAIVRKQINRGKSSISLSNFIESKPNFELEISRNLVLSEVNAGNKFKGLLLLDSQIEENYKEKDDIAFANLYNTFINKRVRYINEKLEIKKTK